MPEVGGKHFPYTKRGRRVARRARRRNYSSDALAMAQALKG